MKETAEQISRRMARVRHFDTAPELIVRKLLHKLGYRFRIHRKDLPGRPDLTLPRHRAVIFVHGCFWHGHVGCRRARLPQTNVTFWQEKVRRNAERDERTLGQLAEAGWRALVIWECQTKDTVTLRQILMTFLANEVV